MLLNGYETTTKETLAWEKKRRSVTPQQAEKLIAECRELLDLSTLKHQKRVRRASDETRPAREALQRMTTGWKDSETRDMLLLKQLVQSGKFSDFPGRSQQQGMLSLGNLGELK